MNPQCFGGQASLPASVTARIPVVCAVRFLLLMYLLFSFGAHASDYEILETNSSITIESDSYATEHHAFKVKVLSDAGAGYRHYEAVNGYIQIKNVTGSVALPNGKTLTLKKEHVMEVPISESADTLSDYKALVISPPDLEKGSVVQIEYDRQVTSLLYLDRWVYATSVPVRKASCSIAFPSRLNLKYRGHDEHISIRKSEAAGKTMLVFETGNRPPVVLEGTAEHFSSVERKITFLPEQLKTEKWQLFTSSWQKIADWFSELSRFAYNSNSEMDSVAQQVSARFKNHEQIAEALYEYVQKNFAYTAVEVGIGGYKPRFALQTFQKKYGDCKDLTLLYLTLLRKAGVEGYPALVDTRSAKFFYQDFPSPTQFNHCIAYLPNVRNGTWVDSTVKNFRLGEVPVVLQGKYALVAGGPNALVKIPENFRESNVVRFRGSATDHGQQLEIKGVLETQGQSSFIVDFMRNALAKNIAQQYVYRRFLLPGSPVRKVEISPESDRAIKLNFVTPVNQMKRYRLLLVNTMHYPAIEKSSLDAKSTQYFALDSPARLIVDIELDLAGNKLITKPVAHSMTGEFTDFKLEISEQQGKVKYFADAYFANGFLNSQEMQVYQQELRHIASVLQRTLVVE